MTTTILRLPEQYKIIEERENISDYLFLVEYDQPASCPFCGFLFLDKHGRKEKIYMDEPIGRRRVGIQVSRQRYKCQQCGKTFIQELPEMDDEHEMTTRLVKYIEQEAFMMTFADLSKRVAVSERTVKRVFDAYVEKKDEERKKSIIFAPTWLGLDENKLGGQYRGIFTDLKNRTILDLIERRTKEKVVKFINGLVGRDKVEVVCMDMWDTYRIVARELMPQAKIVVDKFHFVRMANEAMDVARKDIRASLTDKQRRLLKHEKHILNSRRANLSDTDFIRLSEWTSNFPELAAIYDLKEELFEIWDGDNREDAEKQYDEWVKKIPDAYFDAFKPIISAGINWRDELFNYFNNGATNAFTECWNGLAKLENKMGRGYSFAVLRARMLYCGDCEEYYRRSFGDGIMFHPSIVPVPRDNPHLPDGYRVIRGMKFSTLEYLLDHDEFLPLSTRHAG